MKNIVFLLFTLLQLNTVFAQATKIFPNGTVTLANEQQIRFINFRFIDDTVVFYNTETNTEQTYYKNVIKKITNFNDKLLYINGNVLEMDKKDSINPVKINKEITINNNPKNIDETTVAKEVSKQNSEKYNDTISNLNFISASNITKQNIKLTPNQVREILKTNSFALDKYNSGRTTKTIGDVMLGFGLGFFIGSGISNINKANKSSSEGKYSYESDSKSGPSTGIIIGLAITVASIPVKIAGANAVKKSIKTYNEKPISAAPVIQLKINSNGVGLAYSW